MNIKHNKSLDIIRALAIMLVVANHAIEMTYPFGTDLKAVEIYNSMPLYNQIFQYVIFTLGRLGVPLFFMLTGYLLLTRNFDLNGIKHFYTHNFLRLLLVWYLWLVLYNLFLCGVEGAPFSIKQLALEILLIKDVNLMHVWYMREIIIIYAIIPIISIILNLISKYIPAYFVVILLFFYSVINDLLGEAVRKPKVR